MGQVRVCEDGMSRNWESRRGKGKDVNEDEAGEEAKGENNEKKEKGEKDDEEREE